MPEPPWPCCDCCLGDDCDGDHDQPCDIHQLTGAEREAGAWQRSE